MIHRLIKRICFFVSKRLFLKLIGVKYGTGCRFIDLRPDTFGSEPYLVTLGNHVTVTSGVKFITHDGGVWVLRDKHPAIDVIAPISIGKNVFIGLNSIIMPGASIGNNCVIGAGSVVAGELAENAVYAGVPARKIYDLDEYEKKCLQRDIGTKGLSAAEKRETLLRRFSGDRGVDS